MKIHFLENKIKLDTTILAKSSEKLPYYPVENIKTSSPKTKWRTDGLQTMNEWISFDLTSPKTIDMVQALGSNIRDTAWCYVEGADDAGFSVNLVSQFVSGEDLKAGKFLSQMTKRYIRLKVYDGQCFVGTSGGSAAAYDACIVDNKIYVCSQHRISIFSAEDFSYINYFGSFGTGDGRFSTPVSICSDGIYLYVDDRYNHRIQKFTLTGEFVLKIGTQGAGSDQFDEPLCIRYYNSKLYVADRNNNRVKIHNADDLTFFDNIPVAVSPFGCSVDETNNYLISRGQNGIYVYNLMDKSLVRSKTGLSFGYGIALLGDYLYCSESANNKISKYLYSDLSFIASYSPGTGSLPGQLAYPYHLNIWDGNILCCNGGSPYYVLTITPDLKFQSNPDGYLEVGRFIAAEKKSLTRQAVTKFDDRYDDKSIAIETDALVVFHIMKEPLYRLSIDIEQLHSSDKAIIENFFLEHGLTKAFTLYIEDETEGNYVIPNVRFQSEPVFKYVAYDNFSTSIEVVEVK